MQILRAGLIRFVILACVLCAYMGSFCLMGNGIYVEILEKHRWSLRMSIGAFEVQPEAVIMWVRALHTLPKQSIAFDPIETLSDNDLDDVPKL